MLQALKNSSYINVTSDEDFNKIGGVSETLTITVDGENKTFHSAFLTTGGIQTLSQLPEGIYRLVEEYVPTGYINTLGDVKFKIEYGKMTMITQVTEGGKIGFVPASGGAIPTSAKLTITNEPGAALPATGGTGTTIFYLFGLLLTTLAGVGVVMKRRRVA